LGRKKKLKYVIRVRIYTTKNKEETEAQHIARSAGGPTVLK